MKLLDLYQHLAKQGFKSDKGSTHSYLPVYEELFAPYRKPGCRMLEIGLFNGDSLRLWDSYFVGGSVCGVDLCDRPLGMADLRPMIAEGFDIKLMSAVDPAQVDQHFTGQFDVIVEDASHAVEEQVQIYRNFRDKLAPGGVYVIEDVQDIDATRHVFESLDPSRWIEILDRRKVKGRYDDVLVVIRD